MAREYTRRVDYQSLPLLRMKDCFKCHIVFKVTDMITTVTVRVSSSGKERSRIYHEDCWQKVLQ